MLIIFSSAAISKSLEPVTGQLNNTIAAKLTAVEVTLKENVTKVVKSKVRRLNLHLLHLLLSFLSPF